MTHPFIVMAETTYSTIFKFLTAVVSIKFISLFILLFTRGKMET